MGNVIARNFVAGIKNLRAHVEPDPHKPFYLLTELGHSYRLRAAAL